MRVLASARGSAGGVLALVALAVGCGHTGRHSGDVVAAGAGTNSGGSAGSNSSTGGGTVSAGGAESSALQAVPSQMHRLNATEYQATVADMLGPESDRGLSVADAELDGFDNNAQALSMNEDFYARYFDAAKLIADDVFASADFKARVVTCQAADDATCVHSVTSATGLRLFRRPLLEPELAAYAKVYADARTRGEAHESALKRVLTALLASAQFLYRIEFVGQNPGTQPLGPYEVASRLSYLLWSSAPDATLLGAAESNALAQDEQLTSQFTRLLDDPKSARFVESFAGQWLRARQLAKHATSTQVFPDWTPEVADAATTEVYRYFDDFLYGDQPWPEFLKSRTHYINGALAKLYGQDLAGDELQQVTLDQRAGFLSTVGFLTVTSHDIRTSPTQRGKFILERLLCAPPPPPPSPEVPKLEPGAQPSTFREKVEQISDNAQCASCHLLMDPLGLALESYDGIGQYRTTYADDGVAVDTNVTWPPSPIDPQGATFTGLADLSDAVTNAAGFQTCLVQNAYAYGLGRSLTDIDKANVQALTEAWQAGPLTIRQALMQLVLSKPFRFRSDGGPP